MSFLDWFRLDGIRDDELSPNSGAKYLTPMERIGVQCREDAEIALRLIEERKQSSAAKEHE